MSQSRICLVVLLVLAIVIRDGENFVRACCPAFAQGSMFRIADQRILIAWDPESKLEHFVREANFKHFRQVQRGTEARSENRAYGAGESLEQDEDFGFLVPTPTQPAVEASDGTVFRRLEEHSKPRVERVTRWRVSPIPLIFMPFALHSKDAFSVRSGPSQIPPKNSVQVLEQKSVAGYDIAVLKADDAGELSRWLREHEYESRPSLEEWAEPYVKKGWIITAFKYAADANRIEANAVRMSFKTDRPIFPYRVPADQIAEENQRNLLRTYVIGPGRIQGTLGEGADAQPWQQATTRFAKPIPREDLSVLLGVSIPHESIAALAGSWLTTCDDRTWPSGTKDLWFDFDAKASEFQEVQRIKVDRVVPIPLDLVLLVVVAGGVMVRRRSRGVNP